MYRKMKQQKAPEISVIMGIYNQQNEEYLEQAIRSVLRQTFPNFEFIIYDDGSNEEVAARLEEYARQDERIRLIRDPKNRGLAYSLNACIDVAKGKYLARMDDDDISEPNRLQVQLDFMESHPEVAFVGCNAKLIDQEGTWGVRKMPEQPQQRDFLRFSPYIHPTVMIRRSIFETEDAYLSSQGTLRCEDYELFMRLQKAGYHGYNLQEELFSYREDRVSYRKRKFCYRMDEAKLRYRNFKEMGCLFPLGWLYVLRPIVAALVPSGLIYLTKKAYHRQDYREQLAPEAGREFLQPGMARNGNNLLADRRPF